MPEEDDPQYPSDVFVEDYRIRLRHVMFMMRRKRWDLLWMVMTMV